MTSTTSTSTTMAATTTTSTPDTTAPTCVVTPSDVPGVSGRDDMDATVRDTGRGFVLAFIRD
jgi:hypothetical protein